MKRLRFKRTYFAMPYAVLGALFVIIPLGIMAVYAFTDADGGFTFSNFVNFFTKPAMIKVLFRSLGVAAITTVACLLIAYPLALVLASSKFNKSAILVLLFVLPMWINSLLRTYAIKIVLNLIGLKSAYAAVVIGMVYDFFPFMLLPLYTILVNTDMSLIEASTDLGASAFKTFLKVRLPLSIPGIMSGILMVFMPTVSTFAISDILGDPSTYMFGNIINQWFNSQAGWHIGSAYSFILLVLIAVTMFIANKLSGGKAQPTGAGGTVL